MGERFRVETGIGSGDRYGGVLRQTFIGYVNIVGKGAWGQGLGILIFGGSVWGGGLRTDLLWARVGDTNRGC